MAETVKETIKRLTRKHLKENDGLVLGQCLTAVGWVGGTLPELYEEDGMVELSMADVAGGGIATGMALAGKRPIYVIRYQGFNWFNAPMIVNYAAKSKEIWNIPCPLLVRGIAMEGGIGPVASSSHHSIYHRMPGIKVASPMTPKEYEDVYETFMEGDDPVYVSEHRGSYNNDKELANVFPKTRCDIVLFPISITRFAAMEAAKELKKHGIMAAVIHIPWLEPLTILNTTAATDALFQARLGGLVIDDDYADGAASAIASRIQEDYRLETAMHKYVGVMGLNKRTAGFHKVVDNPPPNKDEIVHKVRIINEQDKR